MFGTDRQQLRRMFFNAWEKFRRHQPLEPLERMIAEIVVQHPEYHAMLEQPERVLERDYLPEQGQTNPFLHLAMHISIQEQVGTDRPPGVAESYRLLALRCGDPHEAEHRMMECLGEMLWSAQRNHLPPDEQCYLECLKKLP
ncbi:MAG: DUF1841 family protein [gamma proteobacterium symbiont of Phacoides pectinatus]